MLSQTEQDIKDLTFYIEESDSEGRMIMAWRRLKTIVESTISSLAQEKT